MTAATKPAPRTLPRFLVRTFWILHRTLYRLSGGRIGLSQPATGQRFGMMRLHTVGRRSGRPRIAILGYYQDGANLVTLAMNGWGRTEPAWWLNLQAAPDAVVELTDGPRLVRARAATDDERERLWATFADYPGWGEDIDALAARRPTETAVVVLEPRPVGHGADGVEAADESDPHAARRVDGPPTGALAVATEGNRGRRLRPRHLWIVPGLGIALLASLQANAQGLGIVPLLVFGIAPDLPRLLGIGQPHARGQMAARAVPAFNVMHHSAPPLALLALGATGVVPPALFVGALAWLGHIVAGFALGDRRRQPDGFLRPLWPIGRPVARTVPFSEKGYSS